MVAWEDYSAYDANVGGIAIVDLTRYGLGARGIDLISAKRTTSEIANDELMTNVTTDPVLGSTNERVSFPLYDGHGNTIATLARNGTGYSIANEKRYDVWGKVRSDSSVGSSGQILNPTQKYCGNLGHKYDATSDLTYMRARYFEAETGRFISEDPSRDGLNWYVYCINSPSLATDPSGAMSMCLELGMIAGFVFALQAIFELRMGNPVEAISSAISAIGFFAMAFTASNFVEGAKSPIGFGVAAGSMLLIGAPLNQMIGYVGKLGLPSWLNGILPNMLANTASGSNSMASVAVYGVFLYTMVIIGALIAIDTLE